MDVRIGVTYSPKELELELADDADPKALKAAVEADPINPQKIATELTPRLPDRAIVTADSGTTTVWWARNLDLREGMMGSVSGTLATMGCSVPYAIAAKFAHPDRPVIALVGDGAMQMNGMSELITISRYWRQWTDPRLIVMALNNRELPSSPGRNASRSATRNGLQARPCPTFPMPTSPS